MPGTHNDSDELAKLDNALTQFEAFLNGDGTTIPSLRANWIYLQIFATYGLRLPSTQAALLNTLRLTPEDAPAYGWFSAMLEGYGNLDGASRYFFTEVWGKMLALGGGLRNFATDVVGQDSMFTLIANLVQPGPDQDLRAALDLVKPLKEAADANAAAAGAIKEGLSSYKAKLVGSKAELDAVKKAVDNDDRTSSETIEQLGGDKDDTRSLAYLDEQLKGYREEYTKDAIVAGTAPTYMWVFPIGTLVGLGVMIGFTTKAVLELKVIDDAMGVLHDLEDKLATAIAVQGTVGLAHESLDNVLAHLQVAIEKTTAVQNGWLALGEGLDYIAGKVDASLKADGQLAAAAAVKTFMNRAQQRWAAFKPTIEALMKNPVITVDPDEMKLEDFLERLKHEMTAKASE